jgi:7-cyano-7-deazaguanine reductase
MPATPDDIGGSPLGRATGYPDTYDPAQLFAVPRARQRAALGLTGTLPFSGNDIWTAYELTWLDPRGKPAVAIATIDVPAESPSIVESKSMKLYLGSFAQSSYASPEIVATTVARDLAEAVGAPVRISLRDPTTFGAEQFAELEGESLDGLPLVARRTGRPHIARRGRRSRRGSATTTCSDRCARSPANCIASVRIAYRGHA